MKNHDLTWYSDYRWKVNFVQNPIGSFSSFFLTIMKTLIKSLDFTIFANSYQKNIKKSLMFFLQSIYFVLVFFMVFHFFMKIIDTPPRRHYFSVFCCFCYHSFSTQFSIPNIYKGKTLFFQKNMYFIGV